MDNINETIINGLTDLKAQVGAAVKKDELEKAISAAASKDEVKAIADNLTITKELAEKLNERLGQIQVKDQPKADFGTELKKAIREQFDAIKAVSENSGKSYKLEMKQSTMDFSTSFTTADSTVTQVRPGIVALPNRRIHARSLVPGGSIGTLNFSYIAETGVVGAPALWGGYAVAKPKMEITYEEKDAPVRDLPAYLKVTRRMFDDVDSLSSHIQMRAMEKYLDKEDNVILMGPNNTSPNITGLTVAATGAVSAAARTIDRIVLTKAGLENNNYYPNACLVNPIQWHEILLNQATDKSYSYPVVFNAATNQLTLAGIPLIPHQEIPLGKFLLGDFANGVQLLTRQAPTIEFANQNEDDFIKNVITIRIEGRIALPIYYPAAFAYGDTGTFSGS